MKAKTFSEGEVIELPFGLVGKIYRSPMPFSKHDQGGALFSRFQSLDASVIVLLAEQAESFHQTGIDLAQYYQGHGFDVIDLPIPDYNVPEKEKLDQAIAATITHARDGDHIIVHCQGGLGRTGTFLACLAKHHFGLTGGEAINWVREYVPGAVETDEQVQFINDY